MTASTVWHRMSRLEQLGVIRKRVACSIAVGRLKRWAVQQARDVRGRKLLAPRCAPWPAAGVLACAAASRRGRAHTDDP